MSIWTHVAGVIRIDGLEGMPEPDLGNTCNFFDEQDVWEACSVPCGSEGSLSYTVWTNPNSSQIARWTCTIWGDLRDYDSVEEIRAYFERITDGYMVRQGAFTVEVEGQPRQTFCFKNDVWIKEGSA